MNFGQNKSFQHKLDQMQFRSKPEFQLDFVVWDSEKNFKAPKLTGFEMILMMALGQYFAQASVRFLTMLALVLNKSSLVIPEKKVAYIN